ncbi:hypothetical protein PCC6912_39450 [Chlorogloeopsis fritschii PCC 6912]|uniref:Uncharacterized protein n=1 Tax=Chlorogloeopsis fritschii PCC 6912 TaxID=211165 RepID=A0A433N656_CHLFR|nr:hypothetical protein [Chlorogloeopsis fritschii]RUR76986.1 hypothetical protein PCC6912_39450 [Chlorogloeopsis fritschii PCC 6912]
MPKKVVQLETARRSDRLFYVWFDGEYQAIDVTGKSKTDAIALLPSPTPNFVQQVARNKDDAIAIVKDTQAQDLLASPV